MAALWLLLALFVIYPLLMLAGTAFMEEGRPALGPLLSVLQKPGTQRAFLNSLLLGTLVGIIGTALGFLFAFTVSRANLPPGWVRVIDAMTLLPLISPPFTTSIAFIFSFGPRGLITYELLGIRGTNVYGLSSTLAAEVLTYFPIAYLALRPVLAAIGGNLEEMAFSLGSSRLNVFRTVTLPLALPGLANAFLLLFAASLADFATPLILAGNSLPGAADRSLSADHRPVRSQGRRRDVAAAAGAGRARLFRAARLGRARALRHDQRQVRRAIHDPQRDARDALAADPGLPRGRVLHRLSLRAAAARLAGRRLRRQPHLDARALPRDLHRRPQGDHRYA